MIPEQASRQSGDSQQQRPRTVLESVEEARELIRHSQTLKQTIPTGLGKASGAAQLPQTARTVDKGPAAHASANPDADTVPFRPSLRPTMAVLTVFDDGGRDGEVIRIRKELFVIGREAGDLLISHDSQISHTHAEISRRWDPRKEGFRWYVRDLGSRNGTFARVPAYPLHHRQELILGNTRFRFDAPSQGAATAAVETAPPGTMKWQRDAPGALSTASEQFAAFVEMLPQDKERRFSLIQGEYSIGRDAGASSIVVDDPMLSPRHARIYRDPQGVWNIEDVKSLNGLWARIDEALINRNGQFQCGEQRFFIKIP